MAVAETSREAFARIKDSLGTREEQVLHAIEELGEASLYQVAHYLKLDMHKVSGRITDLRKKGAIELVGKLTLRDGIREQVWKIKQKKPEAPEQLKLEMDCGDG